MVEKYPSHNCHVPYYSMLVKVISRPASWKPSSKLRSLKIWVHFLKPDSPNQTTYEMKSRN